MAQVGIPNVTANTFVRNYVNERWTAGTAENVYDAVPDNVIYQQFEYESNSEQGLLKENLLVLGVFPPARDNLPRRGMIVSDLNHFQRSVTDEEYESGFDNSVNLRLVAVSDGLLNGVYDYDPVDGQNPPYTQNPITLGKSFIGHFNDVKHRKAIFRDPNLVNQFYTSYVIPLPPNFEDLVENEIFYIFYDIDSDTHKSCYEIVLLDNGVEIEASRVSLLNLIDADTAVNGSIIVQKEFYEDVDVQRRNNFVRRNYTMAINLNNISPIITEFLVSGYFMDINVDNTGNNFGGDTVRLKLRNFKITQAGILEMIINKMVQDLEITRLDTLVFDDNIVLSFQIFNNLGLV